MEKKEIKKRSKTPIVVVIIALLAVAGFCYYKFVWLPEDLAKYEIAEETPVETKVVGEVSANDLSLIEIQDGLFSIMEESDATYFAIEFIHEEYNDRYVVTQMSKDAFNEVSSENVFSLSKYVSKGFNDFFNTSYDSYPEDPYPNALAKNADGLFGDMHSCDEAQETIESTFGSGTEDYFNMHELVLSCDGVTQEKVAYLKDIGDVEKYLFKSYATVVTENSVGDMSELGVFEQKGKSSDIDIYTIFPYEPYSKRFFLDNIKFKY